jgi:hypothetical protein
MTAVSDIIAHKKVAPGQSCFPGACSVTNSDTEVQQPEPEVGSSRLLERSVDQEESLGFPFPKPSSVAVDQEAL